MPETFAPALLPEHGERLVREAYRKDFRERSAALRDADSWKLVRGYDDPRAAAMRERVEAALGRA